MRHPDLEFLDRSATRQPVEYLGGRETMTRSSGPDTGRPQDWQTRAAGRHDSGPDLQTRAAWL
jgi:hypothetical protein